MTPHTRPRMPAPLRRAATSFLPLALGMAACGAGEDGGGGTSGDKEYGFDYIACPTDAPDVSTERLCPDAADPGAAADVVNIPCDLETACFAPEPPRRSDPIDPIDEVLVMAWNIERGLRLDAQIAAFDGGTLPTPDVLLLSEVDRGCSRTDGRNVAREMAQALEMNYAYGVEFVELPRADGPGGTIDAPCEHGNAILSRFPIANVELIRHRTNKSWFEHEGEPRLGGRMALRADLDVQGTPLHVYAVHLESGILDGDYRADQAAELVEDAALQPFTTVLAGDYNSAGYRADVAAGSVNDEVWAAFQPAGFIDAHASLSVDARETHRPAAIIDIIFVDDDLASDPGLCSFDDCPDLSDHTPIWATIRI